MIRVQQRRTKGWRAPEGVKSVARSSRWGNPYSVEETVDESGDPRFVVVGPQDMNGIAGLKFEMRETAIGAVVHLYRNYAIQRLEEEPGWLDPLLDAEGVMCFCAEEELCHGDVLINELIPWAKEVRERTRGG